MSKKRPTAKNRTAPRGPEAIAPEQPAEHTEITPYIPDPADAATEAAGRLLAVTFILDRLAEERSDDPDDGGYALASVREQLSDIRKLLVRSVEHDEQRQ